MASQSLSLLPPVANPSIGLVPTSGSPWRFPFQDLRSLVFAHSYYIINSVGVCSGEEGAQEERRPLGEAERDGAQGKGWALGM